MFTVRYTLRGTVVWTAALAVTLAGCAAQQSPVASAGSQPARESEAPMRPAAASLALSAREASPRTTVGSEDVRSISAADTDVASSTNVASAGADDAYAPECFMHAESTPRGIALVFSARTSTPDQVAAQVHAIAAELELAAGESPEARSGEPSSFGTRRIAELAARITAAETPEGGRVTIDAEDPEGAQTLRARVLWHMADFLPDARDDRGLCPVIPRLSAKQRQRDFNAPAADSSQRSAP